MALDLYSGIVLNQNQASSGALATASYYQTFQLPADFQRGATIPPVTGFQLCTNVTTAATATLVWEFDQLIGATWTNLASGTTEGTSQTGQVWFNVFFPAPVTLDTTWSNATFRISVTNSAGLGGILYSSPNPLATGQAFHSDTTAVLVGGNPVSMMFRILAGVADSGTDFLGNLYRSVVVKSTIDNIAATGNFDAYWMSQPNPSQFGVESFYLDMRSENDAVVLDRMTLDPLTPGVYAHIYYSNDPNGPGVDIATWDNLLWTPAYLPVQMTRKQTFAFPQPITAKYIKVEFSNLQARSYDPGAYQIPSSFRKFPKWVLDFFLGQFASVAPDLLSSGVDVTYDALDLAYSYYTGDIINEPDTPALAQPTTSQQPQLFTTAPSSSDQVDPKTLAQIRLAFQPFRTQPALAGDTSTMLGSFAASVATSNYSTETIQAALGNTSLVSNLQREALLVEKAFPAMFFFLPCRHGYRVSQALFESNIGYFAGVRQLAFHRDIYTGPVDQVQYNETLGDGANLLINDWVG